jgi:hypothetical protein
MAQKTLKQLLGSSGEREQVDLNLDQATFRAPNVAAGQYSVQVQQAPTQNTALTLARSLQGFSGVLKNYADVQEEIGLKQAAGVEDKDLYKELEKTNPAAFLSFKRDNAYRNSLYKRALTYDILPSLDTDSEGLLNIEQFGAKTNKFLDDRLDPYIAEKWNEFSEKVGEYSNDPAAKAVWNSAISGWRSEMVTNYNDKIVSYNKGAQKEELGLQIEGLVRRRMDEQGNQIATDFSTLPDILQNRDNLLAEDNVPNIERTQILANEVNNQAKGLLAEGRVSDAEKLIAITEATKINGKPVFRTGESSRLFAALKQQIDNASDQEDALSKADIRRTFTGKVISVYEVLSGLNNLKDIDNLTRETVIDTFESINPNISQEEIDQKLEEIFNNPSITSGYDQALRELAINGSDVGNSLYFDTKTDINKELASAQSRTVIVSNLTEKQKSEYIEEFSAWKKDNPQKTAKQWLVSKDLNIPMFAALRAKDEELSRGNWVFDNLYYENADDTLANAINRAVAPDLVKLDAEELAQTKNLISGMADQLKLNLSLETQDYAKNLDPLLSAEERNVMIRDFIQLKSGESAQRVSDFNKAFQSRGLTMDESSDAQIARIQTAEAKVEDKLKRPKKVVYSHLENPNGRYPSELVEKERETMLQRGNKLQLQKSLINTGYLSWDASSWKLLDETDLSAQDVKLFGSDAELNRVTAEWSSVMIKELSLVELTKEEEKIKDTFQDFGIYDLSTLNTFLAEQGQFFEDRD